MKIFAVDDQLDYEDVLIQPCPSRVNTRKDVCLAKRYMSKNGDVIANGIPIMNSNMSTVGNFKVAKAMLDDNMFATIHKHYSVDEIVEFVKTLPEEQARRLFISIGLREQFMNYDKLLEVRSKLIAQGYYPCHVCVDVPNAYITDAVDLVKTVSSTATGSIIMAGNVCTFDGTTRLCYAGAHIVKVGIGPGTACRTRFVTGVGRPQLSAIFDCVESAKTGYQATICADGGITHPGDVAKAFAAGAEFVMLGGFYAGTEEAEGEYLADPRTGQRVKAFYGMASKIAQERFYGGVADYKTSEGALLTVPDQGTVHDQNLKILGGLRSACTYCNALNLEEFAKNAVFYKVRRQHTINKGGE